MYVHDTRLQLALGIVQHPGNVVHVSVIKHLDNFFNLYKYSLKMKNEEPDVHLSHMATQVASLLETSTSTPTRSPSKSPNDPRFTTKQVKVKNMIPFHLPSKYKKTRVLNYDE